MTQKLKAEEIPQKGWSMIEDNGEIKMWVNLPDGAIIMFPKRNEAVFVTQKEIIDYAESQLSKPGARVIDKPAKPI